MLINYKDLCLQLGITTEYSHATTSELELLKKWVNENISSDISFKGDTQTQFKKYLLFMKKFQEKFLPSIHLLAKSNGDVTFSHVIQASMKGYDRYIEKLSSLDIDWCTADQNGMTPLHWAAARGYPNTVKILLKRGADPDAYTVANKLPIDCCLFIPSRHDASLIHHKREIFELLLPVTTQKFSSKDADGDTLMHRIALHDLHDMFSLIKRDDVISLLKETNSQGDSPIHVAIKNGSEKVARLMLSEAPKLLTLAGSHNRTVLHCAVIFSSLEFLEFCCHLKQNLDDYDRDGKRPVDLAKEAGRSDIIDLLIKCGAKEPSLNSTARN